MPYVTISTVRGILDAAQKKQLLERVTDLLVEGQGSADFRRNVWVRIEEQEPTHWSLGGMQPTAEIIAGTFGAIGADGLRLARPKP
ncbi:tautomerase family protein [Bradyrhizobium diazoefficiens]|uniref:tautomerase family protein n=1 Tax=Bradyrhizobium sp. WYCCWR 12699 TaxID=3064203 RepID=UPI001BA6F29F|nr:MULTISPECIES: tautomerase family protein [Bradyrhizobium]MBR0931247.1 tautomerase family protein [Bradyrhizobium diazoefficiens]MDT4742203.1 tautomerase family protein [Bradyrhizobium sp. WYCCWR 12699]